MTWLDLLILLAVAAVCGGIAQRIAGAPRGGCAVSIAVGFIGAVLGMWLAPKLGLPELLVITVGGSAFPIVWSIIGATLFVAIVSLFQRPRRRS